MGRFWLAMACLAALLVLLSITPLRRRLPGLRRFAGGLELLLWVAFVSLCLAAFAGVRTARSTELVQSLARAALDVTVRSVDSSLGPASHWVSIHQPGISVATLALAGIAWALVAIRVLLVLRRRLAPRPRLNDWWLLKPGPRTGPRVEVRPSPSVAPPALVDAHTAAQYLGVSRATVYRWARAGRLRSRRAGTQLQFSSGDLAALRESQSPQRAQRA